MDHGASKGVKNGYCAESKFRIFYKHGTFEICIRHFLQLTKLLLPIVIPNKIGIEPNQKSIQSHSKMKQKENCEK